MCQFPPNSSFITFGYSVKEQPLSNFSCFPNTTKCPEGRFLSFYRGKVSQLSKIHFLKFVKRMLWLFIERRFSLCLYPDVFAGMYSCASMFSRFINSYVGGYTSLYRMSLDPRMIYRL